MSLSLLKKLGAVTAILFTLLILYLYQQVPRQKSPFAKATDKAQRILIQQGPVGIELRKEGSAWNVGLSTGPFFAADVRQVGELLASLKGLQVEDQISDRADRAADYDVTLESATKVSVLNDNGKVLAAGLFGKQAPDIAHIYFRYADDPSVYLARGIIRGELGGVDVHYWKNREQVRTSSETRTSVFKPQN